MKDIAQDLGVSIVTVSKALRNHPDIADATREKVLQRARELGYRPNLMARSLVTGRSSLIGLVVPDLVNPFFAEIAKYLAIELKKHKYFIIVASSDGDPEMERDEIEHLLDLRLGVLVVASSQDHADSLRAVVAQGTPVLLLDRFFPGFASNFVGANDYKMGVLATEHLIANGFRRIAHLRGPHNNIGDQRFAGYRDTLAAHGIGLRDEYVIELQKADTEGRTIGNAAVKQLLALDPRPDAIFCYNDNSAVGAIDAVFEAKLSVPDDIAIIGCGNFHYDDLIKVPLSSVDQSTMEMGQRAAKLILSMISGNTSARPRRIVIEPKVVVRESSSRPVRA